MTTTSGPIVLGPRDPAERWVARRWADVLADDPPDVRLDFAAAGGGPAETQQLRSQVAAELGAEAVRALFTVPTIAGMADVLRARIEGRPDGRAAPLLRTLRVGRGDPLFLFHPAGATTSLYRELVHRLGDRPVYGLERFAGAASVEERARRYADLVRDARPAGPYHLGGWSFGGYLAHETARLLHEAGEAVTIVVLIDTLLPFPVRERPARFAEHIERTYGVAIDAPPGDLPEHDDEARIDALIAHLVSCSPDTGRGVLHHLRAVYLDVRAAERYRPGPLPGRVVLLRADGHHAVDPGWEEHCPGIEVLPVPGTHLSVIEPPHVDTVAAALVAVLGSPPAALENR